MVSTPSAPAPPDPNVTAAAQANLNQSTATTQQLLNMTNQVGPDGKLTYNQSGTNSFVDANGKTVTVPQFTATTELSGSNQGIYDTNQVTKQNIANIGKDQSNRIGALLGTPMKLGNAETEARLMELGSARLTPKFAQDEEALRTRLANSGIRAGSAAFDSEMANFGQTKNDAINQLLLTGRSQANQELLAERNQPINEITALMSGSQVASPTFANTPQTQVGGVDYTGMVNNNYNAAVQQQQMQTSQNNALMGGLFGLGGTLGGMGIYKYSDRRLKTDIRRVGTLDNNLPVYSYRYVNGGPTEIGLMADEVERIHPNAVKDIGGFKAVDYAQAVEA